MRIPIAREGYPFILPPLVAGVAVALAGWWWLALPLGLLAAAMVGFFRDPERQIAGGSDSVVSPADGRIVVCERPAEGGLKLSIFLAPWDVHINRSPITAELVEAEHHPGRFHPAYKPEASSHNEQTRLLLQGQGIELEMRQIVGILARRIVLWKRAGDKLERGERIGLMKFGSRVDLSSRSPLRPLVAVGDKVRAGETILAELER